MPFPDHYLLLLFFLQCEVKLKVVSDANIEGFATDFNNMTIAQLLTLFFVFLLK